MLDFTPLANVVTRLAEGLSRYEQDITDDQLRDGLIQRFEFTYDLSHKMLRRALSEASSTPDEIARMRFPGLIRTANEQGVLPGDWPRWSQYRDMRNITSHTYDETKAIQVVQSIPAFLDEARELLRRLQARDVT